MANNSANALMKEMQKIASNAQIKVQKLSNEATEKSFEYNAKEATAARKWQKSMSDTSHQREVKDLKKAGLNPVLSANSGAQSYTTSSASAQAENPSSAYSNLASQLIGSRAQAYSSDTAAAATRAAAKTSAAAQRAAAAQAAAATRYAAAMAYQTKKDSYEWQRENIKAEYAEKTKYMKAEYSERLKQPVSNFSGLVDKYIQRTGLADVAVSSNLVKKAVKGFSALANDPSKAFKNTLSSLRSASYASMNNTGKNRVNYSLSLLGIRQNTRTRNALVNAIFKKDFSSWNALVANMPRASSSARSGRLGYRSIHIR